MLSCQACSSGQGSKTWTGVKCFILRSGWPNLWLLGLSEEDCVQWFITGSMWKITIRFVLVNGG